MRIIPLFSILAHAFVCLLPCACKGPSDPVSAPRPAPEPIRNGQELQLLQDKAETDSLDADLHGRIWQYHTACGTYDSIIPSAERAYERGLRNGKRLLTVNAAMYLTQTYLLKEEDDQTAYWLARSFEALEGIPEEEYFIRGSIYNMAGIQAMKTEVDYSTALRYFKTALATVEKSGDLLRQGSLLRNIAHIYDIREDASGFEYALRSYELAAGTDDINTRSLAALVLSTMYLRKNDRIQARKYAEESIEHLNDSTYREDNRAYACYNFGDVCTAAGDYARAESYYRRAVEHLPAANTTIAIRTYTSFGNLCMKQGRHRAAIEKYLAAEALFNHCNVECQAPVLSGLSRAYDISGNSLKALEYYKKYSDIRTRTMNFRQEHAFNDLLMKYEQAAHRQEMDRKEMELLKKDRDIMLAVLVISVIGIVFVSICILYGRKNAMYRELVRQNLNYRERLNENRKLKESRARSKQQSGLKIFEELEELMRGGKLYRRKDLTVQMLAEMLGTNTTYMSDAINRFSGKSFPNYLNAFRIEEVLEALSDPANDDPINVIFERAGYMSRTTYTRIFRKETGCTPTQYREGIRKIRSE